MKESFMKNKELDKNQKANKSPVKFSLFHRVSRALPLTVIPYVSNEAVLKTVSEFILIEMKCNVRNRNCIKRYIRWSVFHIKDFFDLLYQLQKAKYTSNL